MAVKALGYITNVEPETDNSYRFRLFIWSAEQSAVNVPNDEYFASGALSATINNSLVAFIRAYAETTWSIEFGMSDTAKLVNPVALL